jgi:hypothetical protein
MVVVEVVETVATSPLRRGISYQACPVYGEVSHGWVTEEGKELSTAEGRG